jgi:FkbM family methyltransferase
MSPSADSASADSDYSLDALSRARNYNRWIYSRARPYLGPRLLDAGAGIGTFSALALEDGREVVAVEPDPALAEMLRSRLGAQARVHELSLEDLPGPVAPASVDAAICFNVIEHIEDDASAVRGIREVLVPGGRLVLLVPAHQRLFGTMDQSYGHHRRYTRRTLTRLLERLEMDLVELRYVNPVGTIGWFIAGRLLHRPAVPEGPLALYDRLVPLFRALDALRLPIGLSLWAVARKR